MTLLPEADRVAAEELTTVERIRNAALQIVAAQGVSGTSLRAVAAAAGVSLGLVQHHFTTKAGLIKAVDDYVLSVVINQITQPVPDTTSDSVAEIGDRGDPDDLRDSQRHGLCRPRIDRRPACRIHDLRRPAEFRHGPVESTR